MEHSDRSRRSVLESPASIHPAHCDLQHGRMLAHISDQSVHVVMISWKRGIRRADGEMMDDDSVDTRVKHRLEEGVEVENVVMKWF